jgi:hypothetical protein
MNISINPNDKTETTKQLMMQTVAIILFNIVFWGSIFIFLIHFHDQRTPQEKASEAEVQMEAKMYHELIDACLAGEELYLNGKAVKCVSIENR